MLGKRKRNAAVVSRAARSEDFSVQVDSESQLNAQDVFKQHFEAQFEPLPSVALSTPPTGRLDKEDTSDVESENSEWDGISTADTVVNTVEVIEHEVVTETTDGIVNGTEVRTFMITKPPTGRSQSKNTQIQSNTEEYEGEVTNLKHDSDLQRLLQESSLLKKAKDGSKADRHRTTDLRLQSLGLKASLYSQEKMPMSHRQGMKSKAGSREGQRRKAARENGIILEKAMQKNGNDKSRRDRGVDAPGVGKFRGGTLKLSRRDIADIQGLKQTLRRR